MKEDIENGMFARTKWGDIGIIYNISYNATETFDFDLYSEKTEKTYMSYEIKKADFEILNLIENGDYINGMPCYEYEKEIVINQNDGSYIKIKELAKYNKIKSIVTREQFKKISYELL